MYLITFGDENTLSIVKDRMTSKIPTITMPIIYDDESGKEYRLKYSGQSENECMLLIVTLGGKHRSKVIKEEEFLCKFADYTTEDCCTEIEAGYGEVGADDPNYDWIMKSREYLDMTISTDFTKDMGLHKRSSHINSTFHATVTFPFREVLYNKVHHIEREEIGKFDLSIGYISQDANEKESDDDDETFSFDIDSDLSGVGENIINLYELHMENMFYGKKLAFKEISSKAFSSKGKKTIKKSFKITFSSEGKSFKNNEEIVRELERISNLELSRVINEEKK